jgi:hypothetical protein
MVNRGELDGRFWALKICHFFEIYFLGNSVFWAAGRSNGVGGVLS